MLHILYYCLILWWAFRCTKQQDSMGDDGDGDDDDDDDDDADTCSFISGQSCDNNNVCKYCAMCLQSSCILGKSRPSNGTVTDGSCNSIQFGTTAQYDWYGYCLSSGNDSSGDYCETRTQCYQYLRNSNTSTGSTWRNLTCDPNSCALVTNNGQPAPPSGTFPPIDDPSGTNHHHNSTHAISPHSAEEHNPTVIALSVSCTLIFVGILVWFIRLWRQSSYWPPPCLKQLHLFSSSARPLPNSAPPSFRSTASYNMTGIATTGSNARQRHIQRSSSFSSISLSNSICRGEEHLPSYYSPEPSPPKYEHAIVTQIRGLLEDSNYHYQAGASSSTSTMNHEEDDATMTMTYRDNALPPPMWMPIYFAQNRTSFSLGRLRRHPQHHQPLTRPLSNSTNTYEGDDSLSSSSATHEHDLGSSSALLSSISTTSGPFTTASAP